MLLGDSVTQGSTGDWTWRYRLWKHLTAGRAAVDFVGPDTETSSYKGAAPSYADPDFDLDHAGRWGRWAAEGRELVGGLVQDHRPDVVVVNLGVNDLLWDGYVDVTVSQLQELIANAQAADPDLDIVVSELLQEWLRTGPFDTEPRAAELNDRLPALAEAMSTETSRVVVADAAHGFALDDTYDGLHPNAAGEVKIAAAVADALAELGVGAAFPRPLPSVPAVPTSAPRVRVAAESGGATVSWSPVTGASAYEVSYRPAGGRPWQLVVAGARRGPVRLTGLRNGRRYAVRVQAWKGASAGAIGEAVVAPQYPPPEAVRKLRARRSARSLSVSWPAAAGATGYRIEWRRPGRAARAKTSTKPGTVLRRLAPHRKYVVTVEPRAGEVPGPRTRASFTTRRR